MTDWLIEWVVCWCVCVLYGCACALFVSVVCRVCLSGWLCDIVLLSPVVCVLVLCLCVFRLLVCDSLR